VTRKDCGVLSASGVRIEWLDLPAPVRATVEAVIGGRVIEARSQVGGFSPGTADRVVTADGRRAFVKAAGAALNERTVELHRREAVVAAALPAGVPAPRLLGVHDDGEWVALIYQDIDGRHPSTPWVDAELSAVLAALHRLSTAEVPPPLRQQLRSTHAELADDLSGWRRIADDPPSTLDSWARNHLNQLCELADRAPGALVGDSLVHTDIRADNLLLSPDGTVAIIDWPWATRGAAWFDTLALLLNVRLYGGYVDVLLDTHIDATPADVTAVLAGLAGYFLDAARKPPPIGLPTVRAFQGAQGQAVVTWLRQRLEPAAPA
jgi:aminoglycoside phosphotransferase (APT) family kinase protein